jgi:hypothetical protein
MVPHRRRAGATDLTGLEQPAYRAANADPVR